MPRILGMFDGSTCYIVVDLEEPGMESSKNSDNHEQYLTTTRPPRLDHPKHADTAKLMLDMTHLRHCKGS